MKRLYGKVFVLCLLIGALVGGCWITYYHMSHGDALLEWITNLNEIVKRSTSDNLIKYGHLTSLTISNDVEEIADFEYAGLTNLISVSIPKSVKRIGSGAFWGCTHLSSIEIPNSVGEINSWAFHSCKLISVTIPNSVTNVGQGAFSDCGGVTVITDKGDAERVKGLYPWNCLRFKER